MNKRGYSADGPSVGLAQALCLGKACSKEERSAHQAVQIALARSGRLIRPKQWNGVA